MEVNKSMGGFKEKIQLAYEEVILRVASLGSGIKSRIEFGYNDAFPLRSTLGFDKSLDGDEVVVTVDVFKGNSQIKITSDLYKNEGKEEYSDPSSFYIMGPKMFLPDSNKKGEIDKALDKWLIEFKKFLIDNNDALLTEISRLD